MNKETVIKSAQQKLIDKPYDIAHDIFHHYRVWENVLLVVVRENLNIEIEKLEIACWWHDFDRGSKDHPTMTNIMRKSGYSEEFINDVKLIINSHSFDDERLDLSEAKLLFDGDKIEYINPGRFIWIGEGVLQSQISLEAARKYTVALEERIVRVVEMLNFATSKELIKRNIEEFIVVLPRMKNKYGVFLESLPEKALRDALSNLS